MVLKVLSNQNDSVVLYSPRQLARSGDWGAAAGLVLSCTSAAVARLELPLRGSITSQQEAVLEGLGEEKHSKEDLEGEERLFGTREGGTALGLKSARYRDTEC